MQRLKENKMNQIEYTEVLKRLNNQNPGIAPVTLINKAYDEIRKDGFFSDEELNAIYEEITQRVNSTK